jgi:hypothetical protein
MTTRRDILTWGAAAPLALGLGGPASAQDMKFFRIGTGGAGGTYFPIGGLLANAISAPPGSTPCDKGGACGVPGLVAIAQTTNASVANCTGVETGQMESGLAAADIVYQAYNGLGTFKDKKYTKLRVIANLFPEHLHLVLPKGGKLNGIADLKGKRVSVFQAGSGTQVAVLEFLKQFNITKADMQTSELNPQQSADRMADGQIDAFIIGGTPLAAISQLAATKGMEIYSMKDTEVATFLKALPYYYEDPIPAKTYEGQANVIKSVAVGAQWIVSADVPEKLVYDVTAALWNANTRKLLDNGHAKAREIKLESALKAVQIPLHPGAEKFYKEKGVKK